MKALDLKVAFGLPPERAVAFLRAKGYLISDNWTEVWQEAHTRAFTVANVATMDVLQDIRQALDSALSKGETLEQFKDQLMPTLKAKGWWGKAVDQTTGEILKTYKNSNVPVQYGNPHRLATIYQTNLQTAYMTGRYQGMKAAVATHPYWQYVAVLDNRTRPAHRALAGMVFRHDDPVWSLIYPPNGFRCRCRVRPMSEFSMKSEGYYLSDSTGYVKQIEVPKSRRDPDAGMTTVTKVKLPHMQHAFYTDPGWSYNPAAKPLQVGP
ncbi:phage minor head protein [Undibacterium sp. SXout11W]|uniref:phage head morphogenesis protein n=1 Tax=Undibacterium sp. SXout11W TaxID=3413050 RepID=UPI003BEF7708